MKNEYLTQATLKDLQVELLSLLKIVDKVYIVNEGSVFFEGLPEDAINNEKIRNFYLGSEFNL